MAAEAHPVPQPGPDRGDIVGSRLWPTYTARSITLTFYVVLFVAGSSDIGVQKFVVAMPTFTRVLQVLAIVLPTVAALITRKLCHDLSGADELEAAKERSGPGRRLRPRQAARVPR